MAPGRKTGNRGILVEESNNYVSVLSITMRRIFHRVFSR
jgi:hypothetical protein